MTHLGPSQSPIYEAVDRARGGPNEPLIPVWRWREVRWPYALSCGEPNARALPTRTYEHSGGVVSGPFGHVLDDQHRPVAVRPWLPGLTRMGHEVQAAA
jgi:hypothetical protein